MPNVDAMATPANAAATNLLMNFSLELLLAGLPYWLAACSKLYAYAKLFGSCANGRVYG
jgi:hypothetical protein